MSEDGQLPLEGLEIEADKPVLVEIAAAPGQADAESAADSEKEATDERTTGTVDRSDNECVETESNSTARVGAEGVPSALYFLTNRMNLNGILSSRLVAPRESFGKYYADLLERCPGWVPLLTQPPGQDLIKAVLAEPGAGAPVIIEFPLSVANSQSVDVPVVHVTAVALTEAIAIHFREERELREHRARGYSNVHPHEDLLKVTPALFTGGSSAEGTCSTPRVAASIDWQRIDRIRGAINAAVTAAGNGEQLAMAAAFLGAERLPPTVTLPAWISWRELDDHGASGDRTMPDQLAVDQVGLRAMYETLGEHDAAEAWSPNVILDEVAAGIQASGLPAELLDSLMRNLQRVRSIVNVEVEFEPFRPNARALVSAKSLLLVLLRSDLGELLAWPPEQTGADDATRIVAAVLAGRLRGLSREAIHLRSVVLDDLTAAWAVRVAHEKAAVLGDIQFAADTRGTVLRVDGVELRVGDPLFPDAVVRYREIAEVKREAARVRVCRALGWPVEHHIEVPEGSCVSPREGGFTISTPSKVSVIARVEEEPFLQQLVTLSGDAKRRALSALDTRRR